MVSWGSLRRASSGAPQPDGSERRLVTDLLACVPHPVACSPRHVTGRTGGGTEPRRPLTGMARSPGTSASTPVLGFCFAASAGGRGPCLLGVTGAQTQGGVVCSGMMGGPLTAMGTSRGQLAGGFLPPPAQVEGRHVLLGP